MPGRAGQVRDVDALIVGAGFSGLYLLHRLRADGLAVRLIDASDGPGGVWRNNRYPGARVDSHVPNYEYSLEAVWRDWSWSERFPSREDLTAYFDHVVEVLDLAGDIDLNTRARAATFDSSCHRWAVTTDVDASYSCQYLLLCTGFGSKPFIPDLPGLERFGGACHHTAQWPAEGVTLDDRHVGVMGTGASGVQVVQEAARCAARVTVFQRSPVMAIPMQQERLDPAVQHAAKAAYVDVFRRRNSSPTSFADISRLDVSALDASDAEREAVYEAAWRQGGFHFWAGTFNDVLTDERANRTAYDFWRDKTRARITDAATAELLAPTDPPYPFGTKRPSLEQTYYDCFNQSNVDLVDLRSTPIDMITPTGVRTTAGDVDLDVLVLATGFDANTGGLTAIDVRDRGGRSLAERWSHGVDTHLGMAVDGFPNMLFVYGPQSAASFCNGPVCAELQGDWVSELLRFMRAGGHDSFDVLPETGPAWSAELARFADATLFGRTDSWYMGANVPGKPRQLLNYPSSGTYIQRLRTCAARTYDGFVFDP
ncbi:MAG: cyclopentanone 1,2-monooxygenase [Ilumatobacteraceae bacterium]|nr:cyclopentanone 1,2-monooxygenase [Ilumatobacteraceae bacterium]